MNKLKEEILLTTGAQIQRLIRPNQIPLKALPLLLLKYLDMVVEEV